MRPSALAGCLAFRPTPANQGSHDGPRADAWVAGAYSFAFFLSIIPSAYSVAAMAHATKAVAGARAI